MIGVCLMPIYNVVVEGVDIRDISIILVYHYMQD